MTLEILDLNEAEESVYQTIVTDQPVTVNALQRACRLGEHAVITAAETLEAKGLINHVSGDPRKFAAVRPDVAFEAILLSKQHEVIRARLLAQRLAGIHGERVLGDEGGQLIELVSEPDVVQHRYEQAFRSARRQVRVIDHPPYLSGGPPAHNKVELAALQRGIRVRTIYDSAGLDSFHELSGDIRECVLAGERAKVITEAPAAFTMFDDRFAILPARASAEHLDSAIVVHRSAILDALSALFELLWRDALPLQPGSHAAPPGEASDPAPEDELLLNLLTAGLTDRSIARQLKTSHRTLQRRIHSLFDRLDAQTRFQAGLRAALLRWVQIENEHELEHRNSARFTTFM